MRRTITMCLLIAQIAGASAQTRGTAPDKSTNKPAQLSKRTEQIAKPQMFGDWQLRCSPPSQQGAPQSCEAVQSIFAKNQSQPFAQIAFGKPALNEPLFVTVVLPVGVSLSTNPKITSTDNEAHPAELAWRRCAPAACFANLALKDEILKRWRVSETSGKLSFKNSTGQDTAIPISFKGLGQALDTLLRQP